MSAVIGILGGMGPRATVEFEQRLIVSMAGGDQQLPKIISINDGSIPDRTEFIVNQGEDPVPRMQSNLQSLEEAGAEVICIPCNTAHAKIIFERLETNTSELVNLPRLVVEEVMANHLSKVLVLATRGTIQAGVYSDFSAPTDEIQNIVDRFISQIKSACSISQEDVQLLMSYICEEAFDCVILGCTELSVLKTELNCKATVIDSLDVLVGSLRRVRS